MIYLEGARRMVEAAELALGTMAKRNQLLPQEERVDEGMEKTNDGKEPAEAVEANGSALLIGTKDQDPSPSPPDSG
jgi:hypothetical protein